MENKLLENLDRIKKERKLNNRSLSAFCDIPYTTIDGLYKKGYENVKLSTLQKLATSLEISLDDLIGLNHNKNELLKNYIAILNNEERLKLIKIIELVFPKVLEND